MNLYLFFYILAWAMAGKENGKLRNQTVPQRAGRRSPVRALPVTCRLATASVYDASRIFFRLALVLAPQSTPTPGDGWLGHGIAHAGKADQRQPVEPQQGNHIHHKYHNQA